VPTTDANDLLGRPKFDECEVGETFTTTNQGFQEIFKPLDHTHYKKNFKKKTPLTQWSNAYFSGGVHFNPPAPGI
jgi:hypothetical protein